MVGLPLDKAVDEEREPPRRAHRLDPLERQAQVPEPRACAALELLERGRDVRGRQLFDPDLEQERAAHAPAFRAIPAVAPPSEASAGFTHFARSASSLSSA